MSIKKASLNGMKNIEYLGHFAQNKFIQQGHNDVPDDPGYAARTEEEVDSARNSPGRLKNDTAMFTGHDGAFGTKEAPVPDTDMDPISVHAREDAAAMARAGIRIGPSGGLDEKSRRFVTLVNKNARAQGKAGPK